MKKCPQCNTVYEDNVTYCLNDGTPLVEESFSMPSEAETDEPDTIIRNEPIVIDIPHHESFNQSPNYQAMPPLPENVVLVPADSATANRNYALFLVLGLLIGGGLVLATFLFSKNYFKDENNSVVKINANANQAAKNISPTASPMLPKNENVAIAPPVTDKHATPNEEFDGIDNGRVIAVNARVRIAPDKNAPIVDTLPMNDRLDIIRRENSNSPWYEVECEHGTTGWMHGDTIEFTK